MSTTVKHGHRYTPLFCEENIWWLCDSLIKNKIRSDCLNVAFISNPGQQVAVFNQLSAKDNEPILWDYHVVLIKTSACETIVYDFDSCLDFPVALTSYIDKSFPFYDAIRPQYQAHFRLIGADNFLSQFYSDRSHMTGVIESQQFPDYEPIQPGGKQTINLQQFIDFSAPLPNCADLPSPAHLLNYFA